MSFLDVNGLAVDAYLDDFERSTSDVQAFARSEGLTLEGALYAAKREWNFTVPWETVGERTTALTGWVKARGHHYTFERVDGATTKFNRYSTDGGPGFDTSVTAHAASKFGTWSGKVNSGGASTVSVTFGSDGRYSVSAWRRIAATSAAFSLFSYVNDGATTRFFLGSSVASSLAWATATAASGYLSLSLEGKNDAGSSATALFDGLMLVPYALTTQQLVARVARTAAEPPFPYIELDGDCLEDLNPVTVKGFVLAESMTQANKNGTQNARSLKISFIER